MLPPYVHPMRVSATTAVALALLSCWTSSAKSICIAGIGNCEKSIEEQLAGSVVRGEYSRLLPSGVTGKWGTLIHFAEGGRRCVAFAAVPWKGPTIDEKSSFCFAPGQEYIERSAVANKAVKNLQGAEDTQNSYYSARLRIVGDLVNLEFAMCWKFKSDLNFKCTSYLASHSMKIRGTYCDYSINDPSIKNITETFCHIYPEN